MLRMLGLFSLDPGPETGLGGSADLFWPAELIPRYLRGACGQTSLMPVI